MASSLFMHNSVAVVASKTCASSLFTNGRCQVRIPRRILHANNNANSFRSQLRVCPALKFNPVRAAVDSGESMNLTSDTRRARGIFDICRARNVVASQGHTQINSSSTGVNLHITKDHSEVLNLMPGMFLLKNWLSKDEQVNIVETCRTLGVGEGGFFMPTFGNGGKMNLWMMCLGMNWNHRTYRYQKRRCTYDNAVAPPIPPHFVPLVEEAIQEAHSALIKEGRLTRRKEIERVLPSMQPDVCVINFYEEWGKLGLHQDKDESRESLQKGIPVVSFSIGDSAEFVYARDRNPRTAYKVTLESGDVLIFGGQSRLVFHKVSHLIPGTAPKWLIQATRLRKGRLNLTFRKI